MWQPQLRTALNNCRRSFFSSFSTILVRFYNILCLFCSMVIILFMGMQAERTQKKGGMVMCASVLLIMCFVMLVLLIIKEIILWPVVIFHILFFIILVTSHWCDISIYTPSLACSNIVQQTVLEKNMEFWSSYNHCTWLGNSGLRGNINSLEIFFVSPWRR
jgi:TRAP-type uncharacterized transport system fused permease subunit